MDLNRVLDGLTKSGIGGGLAGGVAGGLLAGAIGTKKGRRMAGTALKLGGAAAAGTLAYKAWQRYRSDSAPIAAPAPALGDSGGPSPAEETELAVLRAMIAAAHADGHIDDEERTRILLRIERLDLPAQEKAFLMEEIRRPLPVERIVALGRTPELAAEIYAASVLAIDTSRLESARYLNDLAARLRLPDALVMQIHDDVAAPLMPPAHPAPERGHAVA